LKYSLFQVLYFFLIIKMKITIIQSELAWEDKSCNLTNLESLIVPLFNKTDVIILPEMFNTGFSMNTRQLSESPDGETSDWMKKIAQKGNLGICGSYMVKEKKNFFNRMVFVSPESETWYYDKRHLFSIGGEDKFFVSGKSRLIFSFRGVRISTYICYDLRFPVWSRNRNDCDLIIYSANWPESRSSVWHTLLKARAIENQCYVAGSNITGTDGNGIKYHGDSMIIDPWGRTIASAAPNDTCSITGEISMIELSEFRRKFPVLDDADEFTISC
jgi:omega-amidase